MGAIQSGINQSISIAAMLYTQTGQYEQQKIKKANEAKTKATKTRIDEINKNYGLDKENIPENLKGVEATALTRLQEQGRELITPLEEELRQMADPEIAEQDYSEHFESAIKNEFEHPNENWETEETDSPAAQATKDAEKGVSEARAQKKQNPRYQIMHDKRKLARQKEKENKLKLKGGN